MTDFPDSLIDEKPVKKQTTGTSKKKSSTKKKSRGTKPTAADKDTSTAAAPVGVIPASVYKVMHYYTRSNDTFSAVLRECRQEAELSNSNVRIVAHDHDYVTNCNGPADGKCRVITREG